MQMNVPWTGIIRELISWGLISVLRTCPSALECLIWEYVLLQIKITISTSKHRNRHFEILFWFSATFWRHAYFPHPYLYEYTCPTTTLTLRHDTCQCNDRQTHLSTTHRQMTVDMILPVIRGQSLRANQSGILSPQICSPPQIEKQISSGSPKPTW